MNPLRPKQIIKQKQVLQIKNTLTGVGFLLLISYSDLKVVNFQSLREDLAKINPSKNKVNLKVYKNTLLKRAVQGTVWKKLDKFIKGASFVIYSSQDCLSVIKKVFQFIKNHKKVVFQFGFFEDKFISISDFEQLATLPSKEKLLVKMIVTLQSPLCQLIYTLKKIQTNLEST